MSIESGIVSKVWLGQLSYGNCVEIQHVFEDGTVIYSFYAHMKNESVTVKEGISS